VVNVSPDLPAKFKVEKIGPYFSCDVGEGEIQAGQSSLIRVRYQPKVPYLIVLELLHMPHIITCRSIGHCC
jgi:hypothetical protein